ncbi:hypothetical protein K402DRAFT_403951 [Aulographum hederae CBS 113979]|uniref:Major facilitator superfamily (MFS) profile domain-containing protein n=1 Tax=Aulographum hederae CBS 113979 TaxID=1176131 RepID=A0A6G1H1Y7_9PEZI|nr:hypothetical protein K402DRAFT_403951 [Aulographum hederae CBS 113979]
MTCWYEKSEYGFRMDLFFSAATAAGAFGGLFARAITEMDGLGGLAGWAWIFIIEGALTVVIALAAFKIMQAFQASDLRCTDRVFMGYNAFCSMKPRNTGASNNACIITKWKI